MMRNLFEFCSAVPAWAKSLLVAALLILGIQTALQVSASSANLPKQEFAAEALFLPKGIGVEATRQGGPTARPLLTVTIAGPQNGIVNTAYTFTATVGPANVKPPIGFIWEASEQNTVQTIESDLTHSVSFTWETTGTKRITVTAKNASDQAAAQYVLNIGIVPLASVKIDGPTTGITGADYAFSASIGPIDASTPITYIWSPTPKAGQGTPMAIYNWETSEVKNIVLSAANGAGAVTDSHVISVGIVLKSINEVTITGPETATVNGRYEFTSIIDPPDATPPIDYEWSPPPDDGQGTRRASYHWGVTGTRLMSVTATNAAGSNIGVSTVTVLAIPVQNVDIDGPRYPVAGDDSLYHAAIDPVDASLPITYTWWPSPSLAGGDNSDVTYNWKTGGVKTIFVTATNSYRVVTSSYGITVAVIPISVGAVNIEGPSAGTVNVEYAFTAAVNPDSTPPILYEWSPTPNSGQGFGAAQYRWSKPGVYAVSVTATNFYGHAAETFTVTIGSPPEILAYLPLVLRNVCVFGLWECEPNNTCSSANGPLVSGNIYHGYPTDDYDCYYFSMPTAGHIRVKLSDYNMPDTQLILYDQPNPPACHTLTHDPFPPLELEWQGQAGKYITCLFANSKFSSEPYTLEVTYP